MTWVVWRQHRSQLVFASAALAVFAAVVLVTGSFMAHTYDAALQSCRADSTCFDLGDRLFQGDGALFDLIQLTVVVPALLGLFWGAPLVAREVEQGTNKLVWTQSTTRARWMAVKAGWMVLAAAVWGAAISALVTWWSSPSNAVYSQRFQPAHFDTQNLVPVAYAVFAVSLGMAAGSLLRRVLPALAVTAGVFVGLRFLVDSYLRPHLMAPVRAILPLSGGGAANPVGSALVLSRDIVDRAGHPGDIFQAATSCANGVPGSITRAVMSCLQSRGYHTVVTYQPASRYWPFQGIESAIYLALGAALLALAFVWVVRRDA